MYPVVRLHDLEPLLQLLMSTRGSDEHSCMYVGTRRDGPRVKRKSQSKTRNLARSLYAAVSYMHVRGQSPRLSGI
jgi:hypothetical protein